MRPKRKDNGIDIQKRIIKERVETTLSISRLNLLLDLYVVESLI